MLDELRRVRMSHLFIRYVAVLVMVAIDDVIATKMRIVCCVMEAPSCLCGAHRLRLSAMLQDGDRMTKIVDRRMNDHRRFSWALLACRVVALHLL
jgi:hypothetical protein